MLTNVARKLVENSVTLLLYDIYGVVNLSNFKGWFQMEYFFLRPGSDAVLHMSRIECK